MIQDIDSGRDFNDHILSFEGNSGAIAAPEIQYVRHPVSHPLWLALDIISDLKRLLRLQQRWHWLPLRRDLLPSQVL